MADFLQTESATSTLGPPHVKLLACPEGVRYAAA